jgi:hypothetical protein
MKQTIDLLAEMAATPKERPRATREYMPTLLWQLPPADRADTMQFLAEYGRKRGLQ